jgi:hypothetical protein
MSKAEKLIERFNSKPKDFTFDELKRLFLHFGYEEWKTGKTSGSRVAFYNKELDDLIKLHRPHPNPIIKQCYLNEIGKHLKDKGVMK